MTDNEFKNGLTDETKAVLSNLTEREIRVLKERFNIDKDGSYTLKDIEKQFDVTKERIRQIEEKALRKLKKENDDNDPNNKGPETT